MRLTRRHFLGSGALLCGLAVAGAAAVVVAEQPAPGARFLTGREILIVRALSEILFPGAPHFPMDGVAAGVAEEVDRILADMLAPLHANGFRALLHTLEWGTAASRGTAFSQLPPEIRVEVLETWSDPTVFTRRIADDAFRLVLGMAYFQHPDILDHLGWRLGCSDGDAP